MESSFENSTNQLREKDIRLFEEQDFYSRLSLDSTATLDEIKFAFRSLSAKYHPDKVNFDEELRTNYSEIQKLLSEAYSTLTNQEQKNRYDTSLNNSVRFDESPLESYEPSQIEELSNLRALLYLELFDDLDQEKQINITTLSRDISTRISEIKKLGINEEEIIGHIAEPLLIFYATWLTKSLNENSFVSYADSIKYMLGRIGLDINQIQSVEANPIEFL